MGKPVESQYNFHYYQISDAVLNCAIIVITDIYNVSIHSRRAPPHKTLELQVLKLKLTLCRRYLESKNLEILFFSFLF